MTKSTVKAAALAAFAAFLYSSISCANPIMVELSPYGWTTRPDNVFLIAMAALGVEWLAIWFLFRKWGRLRQLLAAFVVINLITFPLTWVLSMCVGFYAELLPLVAEPAMYCLYFRRIHSSPPHVICRVVSANLVSFISGFLLSVPFTTRGF